MATQAGVMRGDLPRERSWAAPRAAVTNAAPAGLPPEVLHAALWEHGVQYYTGVPCAYFGGLLSLLEHEHPGCYIPAANEGAALALACGSVMGERRAAVLVQNSGFGNLINPLTSLAAAFSIPVLILMSWRGDPEGPPDEAQHRLMGAATARILDVLGIRHSRLPPTAETLAGVLDQADRELAEGRAAVILVPKGGIGPWTGDAPPTAGGSAIDPATAVRALQDALTDELVVATTGHLSRQLFACADRPGIFYMQGSMGHAVSIALGVAVARPHRRVVVLDGDGACLMHMGALSTVGAIGPPNLTHVVVDNGCYASTGGQPTTSSTARLDDVARASGYRFVARCEEPGQLADAVRQALRAHGPALLLVRTGVDTRPPPPRATSSLEPGALRARFELTARG